MIPNTRPATILMADDLDIIRRIWKTWLERLGYRVLEATNGQEAVDICQREVPDLILMDVSMPVMDGIAATQRIRKIGGLGGVPIIAVSGDGMVHRQAALAAGCNEYLCKPIDLGLLGNLLDRFVSKHSR